MTNITDNAVEYAVRGSTVEVRLVSVNRVPQLQVRNECEPGLRWQPDKYFEPFYRPDASRNSSTGGNGLGLAICKGVADANDWTPNTSTPG